MVSRHSLGSKAVLRPKVQVRGPTFLQSISHFADDAIAAVQVLLPLLSSDLFPTMVGNKSHGVRQQGFQTHQLLIE